jgi:hypothetical protein
VGIREGEGARVGVAIKELVTQETGFVRDLLDQDTRGGFNAV